MDLVSISCSTSARHHALQSWSRRARANSPQGRGKFSSWLLRKKRRLPARASPTCPSSTSLSIGSSFASAFDRHSVAVQETGSPVVRWRKSCLAAVLSQHASERATGSSVVAQISSLSDWVTQSCCRRSCAEVVKDLWILIARQNRSSTFLGWGPTRKSECCLSKTLSVKLYLYGFNDASSGREKFHY